MNGGEGTLGTSAKWLLAAVGLSLALVTGTGVVWAQEEAEEEAAPAAAPEAEPEAPVSDRPWAKGVSEADQSAALTLFQRGNGFFERGQYQQALTQYREAVEVWDHPAIRYNMAVCLIHLDEPLDAHANLAAGMKYGEAPLNPELFAEGKTYMKLLMGRLAWLTVATKEKGAIVSLNGKVLFKGPGESRKLVVPGSHQLVARKDGMLTHTQDVDAAAGSDDRIDIKLLPLSAGVEMKRRWATWKPWTVLGVGAGTMALGGVAYLLARSDFNTYEQRINDLCETGCRESELPKSVTRLETRAKVENIVSVSLMALGGAAAVSGVVMVFMNRPRAVQQTEERQGLSIVPVVGPDTLAVSSEFRF